MTSPTNNMATDQQFENQPEEESEEELDQDEDMLDISGSYGQDRTQDGLRGAMSRINTAMV